MNRLQVRVGCFIMGLLAGLAFWGIRGSIRLLGLESSARFHLHGLQGGSGVGFGFQSILEGSWVRGFVFGVQGLRVP